MKKSYLPIFMYILNYIIIFAGWMPVVVQQMSRGVWLARIMTIIYIISSFIYLLSILLKKKMRINIINLAVSFIMFWQSIVTLEMDGFKSFNILLIGIPATITLVTLIEIAVREIIDRWDEVRVENKLLEIAEKQMKVEAEQRLQFEGKYTKVFYKILWKNFKWNIKDYLLLLVCNMLIFAFVIIAFGMKQILSDEYYSQGIQMFEGLSRIFINAILPIGVVAAIIFVLLFFYYIKCRGKNFGIFLTLGMRRNELYRYVAMEYITVLGVALIVGSILGASVLLAFVVNSEVFLGIEIPLSAIKNSTFGKAFIAMILICIISLLAAREIFIDFNVGKSTDLRVIGEKIPSKSRLRKIIIVSGMLLCIFFIFRYKNLNNYENVYIILGFLIGTLLLIRYGMAEYLIKERKNKKYIKKLMMHNQLFHKSKTNSAYMGIIFITQFCILFFFLFSTISVTIAEEPEKLYPYDIVFLADENDNTFFEELKEKYELELVEFPALRISTYDSTEQSEEGRPIQGQHIGISESTYHILKKYKDPAYVQKDLFLDSKGKYIYIVYQQDKSVKAHPIGYFIPRSKPTLHIGFPCRLVDINSKNYNGFEQYRVKGEEINSLIGIFGQGMKENLIVFSDDYFEQAKDFWKTTEIIQGHYIEKEEERIEGVNTFQGMTKIVLANVNEDIIDNLSTDLEMHEQKHREEEQRVFGRIYDLSVRYYYTKEHSMQNMKIERTLRITMNILVMLVFWVMNIILVAIKILSEKELSQRRVEFLKCMGMNRNNRLRLLKKELLNYYYYLPTGVGIVSSIIFTICTFYARMYTSQDIIAFLEKMIPLWGVYLIFNTLLMWIIATIYAYRVEEG